MLLGVHTGGTVNGHRVPVGWLGWSRDAAKLAAMGLCCPRTNGGWAHKKELQSALLVSLRALGRVLEGDRQPLPD